VKRISALLKRDQFLQNKSEYETYLRNGYHSQNYELGSFLFSRVEQISIGKLADFASWMLSHKDNNSLYLDRSIIRRIKKGEPSKDDYEYLMKYNYIK